LVHVCDVQPELQWFDDYVGLHDRDSDKSGRMNDPVSDYATHIKAAVKSEMAKRRLQSDSYNHIALSVTKFNPYCQSKLHPAGRCNPS